MAAEPDIWTIPVIIDAVTAVCTVVAVGLATWSTFLSRQGVRESARAVDESIKARKADLAPRLVLERKFLDFHFQWPHPATLNGEPVFLARKDASDKSPSRPTFELSNYGSEPALEIEIDFELEDPNGPFVISPTFAAKGVSVLPGMPGPDQTSVPVAYYSDGKRETGLPLYVKQTEALPHCAPGQTRIVAFPPALLNVLFVRGMEYWDRRGQHSGLVDITLVVTIRCFTIEKEPHTTTFKFVAFPFFNGVHTPLTVCGHFRELPVYRV